MVNSKAQPLHNRPHQPVRGQFVRIFSNIQAGPVKWGKVAMFSRHALYAVAL